MNNTFTHTVGALLLALAPSIAWSAGAVAAATTPNAQLIRQGEYLARAGDCIACHTAGTKGKPFAGGLGMETPIGKVYSTNITPDKKPASATGALPISTS
jgi:mono/diheme cytochrome c family protein